MTEQEQIFIYKVKVRSKYPNSYCLLRHWDYIGHVYIVYKNRYSLAPAVNISAPMQTECEAWESAFNNLKTEQ